MNDETGGFFVVDVGHGSCAAVVKGERAVLLDVGPGSAVLRFLANVGVSVVESVVISHADADHIGGLLALLGSREVEVERIYINADGAKGTELWRDVAYELDALNAAGHLTTTLGVVRGDVVACSLDGWTVEILAPRLRLAQLGPGNRDREGRRITSNSVSVVARVSFEGEHLALVSGDIDHVGYTHLADGTVDLTSAILILPHHGGYAGTPEETAAVNAALVAASGAREVAVSHGRKRHRNPLPLVVEAVQQQHPAVGFRCTQMSMNCLGGEGSLGLETISPWSSAGDDQGMCCAGTMEWLPNGTFQNENLHREHVASKALEALCKGVADRRNR